MIVGPLTLPATVVFLGLVVGAMLLVLSWVLQGEPADLDEPGDDLSAPCGRCRHYNPLHARYCAHCGRPLG